MDNLNKALDIVWGTILVIAFLIFLTVGDRTAALMTSGALYWFTQYCIKAYYTPSTLKLTLKREDLVACMDRAAYYTTIFSKGNERSPIREAKEQTGFNTGEREYKPCEYHQTVKKREAADIMRSWGKPKGFSYLVSKEQAKCLQDEQDLQEKAKAHEQQQVSQIAKDLDKTLSKEAQAMLEEYDQHDRIG